jgi:hypothetical protein
LKIEFIEDRFRKASDAALGRRVSCDASKRGGSQPRYTKQVVCQECCKNTLRFNPFAPAARPFLEIAR